MAYTECFGSVKLRMEKGLGHAILVYHINNIHILTTSKLKNIYNILQTNNCTKVNSLHIVTLSKNLKPL